MCPVAARVRKDSRQALIVYFEGNRSDKHPFASGSRDVELCALWVPLRVVSSCLDSDPCEALVTIKTNFYPAFIVRALSKPSVGAQVAMSHQSRGVSLGFVILIVLALNGQWHLAQLLLVECGRLVLIR